MKYCGVMNEGVISEMMTSASMHIKKTYFFPVQRRALLCCTSPDALMFAKDTQNPALRKNLLKAVGFPDS